MAVQEGRLGRRLHPRSPCRRDAGEPGQHPPKSPDRLALDHVTRERRRLALTLGVSERTLLGWVPQEHHEHYDADGNLTGYTVISRESEWDEDEVTKLIELRIYDAGVCSGCGYHKSLTGDLDNLFAIEVDHCNVCAALAKHGRIQGADDKKAVNAMGKEPAPARKRPSDGRHVSVRYQGRKPADADPQAAESGV